MFDHFELPQANAIFWSVGLLSLLFGRRLFWLVVAVVGCYLSGLAAKAYLPAESDTMVLSFAAIGGVLSIVAVGLIQKVAAALTGFVIGGYVLSVYVQQWAQMTAGNLLLLFAVCGLICALLVLLAYHTGVMVITSVLGAGLIVHATGFTENAGLVLFVALALAGFFIQSGIVHRGRNRGGD